MAIDFPSSPTVGQQYIFAGITYTYTAQGVWSVVAVPVNALLSNVTATITAGYTFTPYNAGTISSGTFTPNPALGNYQYYTNNGAHTLAAPSVDCAIDILVTNGAGAGAIAFSGFISAAPGTPITGDPITTVNAARFLIHIARINSIAFYMVKALQ